jgi:hypothetical protein
LDGEFSRIQRVFGVIFASSRRPQLEAGLALVGAATGTPPASSTMSQ